MGILIRKKLILIIALILTLTYTLTGCVRKSPAAVAPTSTPVPLSPYEQFESDIDNDLLAEIFSEALAGGYPEELNWEKHPDILSVNDVMGPAFTVDSDYSLEIDADFRASLAGTLPKDAEVGKSYELNTANDIIDMDDEARLDALALGDKHIVVFCSVIGLDYMAAYSGKGAVYSKLVRFSFIDIDSRRLLAWVDQGKVGITPPKLTAGSFGGRDKNIYSSIHIWDMLDIFAFSAFDGPSFNDGEFLVVGGTVLKYYGEGGELTLPEGVLHIPGFFRTDPGPRPFRKNKCITEITLPDGLISIAEYAFDDCDSLEYVFIPDSVSEIGENIFGYYNPNGVIIHCHAGSFAEQYAYENDIKVELEEP